ncbi:MAG: 3-phosphoshikimate 1-carboxyvinyltransferase [Gammaproteobacteria bacterium]|nr:3-phosphoshikimate 1-carboxyvinyltransferase [Gammaproteobacteria bacterium]
MSLQFKLQPAGKISGEIRVPGDKSVSHRSIMFGSLAEGITHVSGFLEGEDSLNTLRAFQAMGVEIEGPVDGKVCIHGVGMNGLKPPAKPLDMGNSGTSMRLLSGLLSGQSFDLELIGDRSLTKRPMKRVTDPLALMGARVDTAEGGRPPLKIHGGSQMKGIHYDMPMASAQVKSCLLLAGMYADGETSVTEPAPTRDHTERMLAAFGYPVKTQANKISLQGGGKLTACDIDVPSDISSAAFFMVMAAIAKEADILIKHVGINPTRTGVIDILKLMGADITLQNHQQVGGEPVADVHVRNSQLKGIHVPEALVPLAIDEFPVLFVAAACAQGQTVVSGAHELRVKECDRIQVMADGLVALGVDATATDDGMIINGGAIKSGTVNSHDDHRIAMAFSVASLAAEGEIVIDDCDNVNTSFPTFVELANQVGLQLTTTQTTNSL